MTLFCVIEVNHESLPVLYEKIVLIDIAVFDVLCVKSG